MSMRPPCTCGGFLEHKDNCPRAPLSKEYGRMTVAEVAAAEGATIDPNTGYLLPGGTGKHSHYFKDVSGLDSIDVYRTLLLFNVTDPCLQHAVKKLLVAGGRGGGKDISRDVQEAIDTLARWQAMRAEESRVPHP